MMPSMSYCKFENTLNDLEQCVVALEDARRPADLDQTSYEDESMHDLYDACRAFMCEYRRLFPDADE